MVFPEQGNPVNQMVSAFIHSFSCRHARAGGHARTPALVVMVNETDTGRVPVQLHRKTGARCTLP